VSAVTLNMYLKTAVSCYNIYSPRTLYLRGLVCAFRSLRKADALLFIPLHVMVAPNPCAYHTLFQFSKTKMKHTVSCT